MSLLLSWKQASSVRKSKDSVDDVDDTVGGANIGNSHEGVVDEDRLAGNGSFDGVCL